jgi:uncharacterized protein (TIGR04255 family)
MTNNPRSSDFTRLPNAPLAEVVFEMRWELYGEDNLPPPLKVDPGFPAVVDRFTDGARALGFLTYKDMQPISQTMGWGVFRRHYLKDDQPFPILQIGPGVFAVNQSSEYEWNLFCDLVLKSFHLLMQSYPRLKSYAFTPAHIELRYVDSFDQELVGTVDFFKFAASASTLDVKLPDFLKIEPFSFDDVKARLQMDCKLPNKNSSMFHIDMGSGRNDKIDIIRMETKVSSSSVDIPKIRLGRSSSLERIEEWLTDAHRLTSEFFKSFIRSETMEKFK